VNGNGVLTDFEDDLGVVRSDGTIAYDFGAGTQTYSVYTHHSYGLLLVDRDIDRSGLILGSI
jgi:hypothetical protein